MLPVWTEWTHVAGRLMHKAVSNHLVLTLEAFPTLASWAAFDWTEVWPCLRMDVGMGADQYVSMWNGWP